METRRLQLSPQVRARTIQAACDAVELRPVGDVPADVAASGHVGVLLDRSGNSYLVVDPAGRAPTGRVVVTCRSKQPGLGVLRLQGTCGPACSSDQHPDVRHLLQLHRPLWESHDHLESAADDAADLLVVPIHLEEVRVLVPATATERARSIPVPLGDYRAASPDVWSMDPQPLRAHLEREHQDELRRLVARLRGGRAQDLMISVQAIAPHQLDLACLSADGVTTVAIRFDQTIDHPAHVRHWILEAAGA